MAIINDNEAFAICSAFAGASRPLATAPVHVQSTPISVPLMLLNHHPALSEPAASGSSSAQVLVSTTGGSAYTAEQLPQLLDDLGLHQQAAVFSAVRRLTKLARADFQVRLWRRPSICGL